MDAAQVPLGIQLKALQHVAERAEPAPFDSHLPEKRLPANRRPANGQRLTLQPPSSRRLGSAYDPPATVRPVALTDALLGPAVAPVLNPEFAWDDDNREVLNDFIFTHGKFGLNYSAENPATFASDMDGTAIAGDLGDRMFFSMLPENQVVMPATWAATSQWLTDEAIRELDEIFAGAVIGEMLPTRDNKEYAEALLSVYLDNKTPKTGKPAWKQAPKTIQPAYAWAIQLMAGHTPQQIGDLAEVTVNAALAADIGSKLRIGKREVDAWIRVHQQSADLFRVTQAHGFEAWLTTATCEYVAKRIAPYIGVPVDHVIGARPALDADGKITYGFEGCGVFPDGTQEIMNNGEGKQCFLNKVVRKIADPEQQLRQPAKPTLAMGDSNYDFQGFLGTAELGIVVDRGKKNLMENIRNQIAQGARRLINQPFITP